MKLPGADRILIQRDKILGYLLNSTHPDNQGKAEFFLLLGFHRDDWESLATALRQATQEGEVIQCLETVHGVKYVVEAMLRTPSGRSPWVRMVYIVDRGDVRLRLVTAYPA